MFDIYIRVSRLGERGEEESTEIYEAQCRAWAIQNDVDVDLVVEETDVSGSVAVAERQLEKLVQRVESDESKGIITPYLDRFGRDLIEGALAYRRISQSDGRLICVRDGLDSDRQGDKLQFNVRMAFAEDYLDRVKSNWRDATQRAVDRGVWLAPRIPLGYAKDEQRRLVVNEAEAEVVRGAFQRRAGGMAFSPLTRWVNEQCAERSLRGATMSRTGVRRMVANRVYLGELRVAYGRPDNPLEIRDNHPPIVTEEEWQAAQFKHPFSPRTGRASGARLRGLVFCGTCGRRCKVGASGPRERRKTHYVCTAAGCSAHAALLTSKLDDYVEGALMQAAADHEPYVEAVILGDMRYLTAQQGVKDARRIFENARDSIDLQESLGVRDYATALRVRREAVRVARAALTEVRPPDAAGRTSSVETLTTELAEAAIATDTNARFIDRVVLHPNGRGPHRSAQERSEIYWTGADEPYAD